MKHKLLFG